MWEKKQQHKSEQPSGWQPQAGDAERMKKLQLGEKSRRSKNIEEGGAAQNVRLKSHSLPTLKGPPGRQPLVLGHAASEDKKVISWIVTSKILFKMFASLPLLLFFLSFTLPLPQLLFFFLPFFFSYFL